MQLVAAVEKQIAFLADIHGNAEALEAALHDIKRREVQHVVALGDLLLGGDEPLRTWQLLVEHNVHCVRGLSDIALASVPEERVHRTVAAKELGDADVLQKRAEAFFQTRQDLGEIIVRKLAKLPPRIRVPMPDGNELLAMHGSPFDPGEPFSFEMTEQELITLLADDPADLVLAAGAHAPFERDVDGVRIHGVASICGMYEGERIAQYSLLTPRYVATALEHAWVQY